MENLGMYLEVMQFESQLKKSLVGQVVGCSRRCSLLRSEEQFELSKTQIACFEKCLGKQADQFELQHALFRGKLQEKQALHRVEAGQPVPGRQGPA